MDSAASRSLRNLLAVTPLLFALHVAEEAPGLVAWLNARVEPDLTREFFWSVNAGALVITAMVAGINWMGPSPGTVGAAAVWLSFTTGANSLIHLTGAVLDGGYVPGLVTAAILYLPCYLLFLRYTARTRLLPRSALALLCVLGALPMLVHGYRILFRGTRLF